MRPKRHHYVPVFLLSRFAIDLPSNNPQVHCLDISNGHTRTSSVRNVTVIKDFNKLYDRPDLDPLSVENALRDIEDRASVQIRRLIDGDDVPTIEFGTLAWFIWTQFSRTPLGREWLTSTRQWVIEEEILFGGSNPDLFRRALDEAGISLSEAEIEHQRNQFVDAVLSRNLEVIMDHDEEVTGQLFRASERAEAINQRMTWLGLRPDDQSVFIVGDHPIALYDDKARANAPVSWFSSPSVQVTIPLDPKFCLAMSPGPPMYQELIVSRSVVENINLRSYAWAHWDIFGNSQYAVQSTRANAKKNKRLVGLMEPRALRFRSEDQKPGEPSPLRIRERKSAKRATRSRRSHKSY